MLKWFLIATGGAIGSLARYLIQGWFGQRLAGSVFPMGTFVVNMAGCLVIGVVSGWIESRMIREEYHFALRVGLLGGFTTFSTFGLETFKLANDGEFWLAALNVVLSCAVGLLAVWLGYRLAERWFGVF